MWWPGCCFRLWVFTRRWRTGAGPGATVPLTGFGYALAKGVEKAVAQQGLLGALTGGLTAASGGIAAAVVFGVVMAALCKPRNKR